MSNGLFCIGGPHAGEYITGQVPKGYCHWLIEQEQVLAYFDELNTTPSVIKRLFYGYEQHCKAVAKRNNPFDKNEERADKLLSKIQEHQDIIQCKLKVAEERIKQIQDHYTASFLRSCRTCIVPSPFGEATPLTLSYGKCYKGYLNDAMEFIVYAGTVNGEPEKSMGRISNPICIVP